MYSNSATPTHVFIFSGVNFNFWGNLQEVESEKRKSIGRTNRTTKWKWEGRYEGTYQKRAALKTISFARPNQNYNFLVRSLFTFPTWSEASTCNRNWTTNTSTTAGVIQQRVSGCSPLPPNYYLIITLPVALISLINHFPLSFVL